MVSFQRFHSKLWAFYQRLPQPQKPGQFLPGSPEIGRFPTICRGDPSRTGVKLSRCLVKLAVSNSGYIDMQLKSHCIVVVEIWLKHNLRVKSIDISSQIPTRKLMTKHEKVISVTCLASSNPAMDQWQKMASNMRVVWKVGTYDPNNTS